MNKFLISTFALLMVGVLLFLGIPRAHGADLGTIEELFPDPQLAAKIAATLGKQTGDVLSDTEALGITHLDCSGEGIEDLTGIGFLENLEVLSAGNNGISEVPLELMTLTNLTHLDLSINLLDVIPENIGDLTLLEHLILSTNEGISEIPDSLCTLSHLTQLSIANTSIESIPDGIGNLSALISLDLSANYIVELPDGLCDLSNLEDLLLYENELIALPENIGNLSSLTYLDVYLNYLNRLPDSIADLSSLEGFDFEDNQLYDIPSVVYNHLYGLWDGGVEGYIDLQGYEEEIRQETGVTGEDYALGALEIYQQVLDFDDEPTLTYELTLPDGEVVQLDPVFLGSDLIIPGDLLSQVGIYRLYVYTDGYAPMAYNSENLSSFFFDAEYGQSFEILEAPDPTDPTDPADPTELIETTENPRTNLPQTGGYALVGLGIAALSTGGLILLLKGKRS